MWLFTETGFVSAVVSDIDPTEVSVRSRDKQSLEELCLIGDLEILELPNRDYPYRVITTKDVLKEWITQTIDRADYSNYKGRMGQTRGWDFTEALHNVWSAMHKVTDTASAKKRSLYY